MDGAEYVWDLGDSLLAGFMSSYAPVPEHLRKRRTVNDGGERGGEAPELGGDDDVAGEDEDPGVEDEGVLEPDPSDEVLMNFPGKDETAGVASGSVPRTRRRLIKDGVHVAVQGPGVGSTMDTALDIPVSVVVLFYAINALFVYGDRCHYFSFYMV